MAKLIAEQHLDRAPVNVEQQGNRVLLNTLQHKEMMQMKQMKLSKTPLSLKVINDQLWSCQIDGITVYDQELKQMRRIRDHSDSRWVYSVALLPDDTVAVAGLEYLYRSSTSGDFTRIIAKVTYYDLSVYNGQLFATDRDSHAIHVYDCNTWQRLRTISTPCSEVKHFHNFHRHRICVNLPHISISCRDTHIIYIFDKNGKLKQPYGPNIALENRPKSALDDEDVSEDSSLNGPYICQMDDDDAMLVADKWSKRLLMLTATGQWQQIRLSDKLIWPDDAVWWRGRMYVSTAGEDKLTMFE